MLLHLTSCLQVKNALGVQKPQGLMNPHDNGLFRVGCSQVCCAYLCRAPALRGLLHSCQIAESNPGKAGDTS